MEIIENDRNIRISNEEKHKVAEILTLSALTMADLKEHRKHNYQFSWKRALDVKGASGTVSYIILPIMEVSRIHIFSSNYYLA